MSSAARRKEKAAEWEAFCEREREEEQRVNHLSIRELLEESSADEKVRLVIEAICEHVGIDVWADR